MSIVLLVNEKYGRREIVVCDEYDDTIWTYDETDFSKITIADILNDVIDGEKKERP